MALARVIGLVAGLWLGFFGLAFAQELQPLPALSAHVTDTVGLLPADRRQALESQLVQLEKDKGAQLAVLIVSTTRPEPIESYSLRVAEAWRLGRKGVDDGVLFVVARDDRRMRVEVGYGLEGAVPDAIAKRIIAEVVAPRFKAGDFPGGIEAGVAALVARINGEALPAPTPNAGADDQQMGLEEALVLGIIFTLVVGSVLKAIFGRLLGSTIAAGIVGVGAWTLTSVLLVGAVGAVLAFIFSLVAGSGGAGRIGGGPTIGGGFGGGFGGRGGGGGWSGGGGGFGGGGASGGW
ncbi:hypothetical protein GCM10007933_08900 [Zoogloea oryzae]|uniref:TPM domain-containing protein n=1 Tax=Zoogloea oryzae TaxID=310767 RepID=A0ABQ6F799_9RHOO|nr:TPM domain-containing protein [Zoogloea oryzae]GLT21438.1 hypothetical protein GCM10007933_08900 [Zoogloea oryzae]